MYVALQISRKWCLAALLGVLASMAASPAAGQTVRRPRPGAPSHQLRPATQTRTVGAATPGRFATHRAVTEDDIVAGGTYLEDPETGQLYATGGGSILPPSTAPSQAPAGSSYVEYDDGFVEHGSGFVEHGGFIDHGGYVDYGAAGAACGVALAPCTVLPAGNLELFAGVEAFTGPRNQGGAGSFGFQQGVNWAVPFPAFTCMGGQLGFRATQSSLSGADFTNSSREQGFVTAGLFRRVDMGLQGGLVVDYLAESWYNSINLVNLRGELSWMLDGIHDFGFWFTAGISSTQAAMPAQRDALRPLEEWVPTDLYAFFYRRQFGGFRDGDARLFAGWTGGSDGLIGVDVRLPLSPDWALESNFAYLIPSEGAGLGFAGGHAEESWNLGINLVWYPGRLFGQGDSYYRPLFRVADNGTFMIDRRDP